MADGLDVVPSEAEPSLGIRNREGIAEELSDVLADTYRLVFKTHAYHWNVEGPLFYSIHKLTEEQYQDLFEAADTIAERMRALGALAPLTLKQIMDDSIVQDASKMPSAREMVEDLASDHERVSQRFAALSEMADERRDGATADLANARMAFHDGAAWMLRAIAAQ